MTVIIKCKNICKEYGDKTILKNINLDIKLGEKIGIVGENGAGKTTLVNIITNNIEADSGQVIFYKQGIEIGYMRQSTEYSGLENYLSGGEKTKAVLKEILYGNYGILILDEPTNHLDYEGVEWLIRRINNFKGTIIIISHDRYFLDKTVNGVIEIENSTIKKYAGNYSAYREKKRKSYEDAVHAYIEQEKTKEKINQQIIELKKWSNKGHKEAAKKAIETGNKKGGKQFNRAKAKRIDARVKSKIKSLERIEVGGLEKPKEEREIIFNIDKSPKIGSVVLEAKDINKSFNKKILFNKSSFYVKQGEKVGVVGVNGCGKSTLIKAIIGLEDINGDINISNNRNIGYISQEVIGIDENLTLLDIFDTSNKKEQGELRNELFLMGFDSESLQKKVGVMSLGERMKIKLLLMIRQKCEILILDEPTNHIDIHVREQLESVLDRYNGTIILITHDRYLLSKITNKLLVFENKKIKRYEYGFKEYLEKTNENSRIKEKERQNEKIILENRMECIISELSISDSNSKIYKELEREYNELLDKRKLYK